MCTTRLDEVEARIDVLSKVLQELVRQLPPERANSMTYVLTSLLVGPLAINEPGPRDDGAAQEVGALLTALAEPLSTARHHDLR